MLPVLQTAIVTAFDERCSLQALEIPLLVTVADVPLLGMSAVFPADPKSPLSSEAFAAELADTGEERAL